jgi:hypothetical protein
MVNEAMENISFRRFGAVSIEKEPDICRLRFGSRKPRGGNYWSSIFDTVTSR